MQNLVTFIRERGSNFIPQSAPDQPAPPLFDKFFDEVLPPASLLRFKRGSPFKDFVVTLNRRLKMMLTCRSFFFWT